MKFRNPYWSDKDKIELLSKWIIVQSIVYYRLGTSHVDDFKFDSNSKQLVKLMKHNSKASKASKWYYVMYDFDGTTGFQLYDRLNKKHKEELEIIAHNLAYDIYRRCR